MSAPRRIPISNDQYHDYLIGKGPHVVRSYAYRGVLANPTSPTQWVIDHAEDKALGFVDLVPAWPMDDKRWYGDYITADQIADPEEASLHRMWPMVESGIGGPRAGRDAAGDDSWEAARLAAWDEYNAAKAEQPGGRQMEMF